MGVTAGELLLWIRGDDSHLEKSLAGAEKKTQSAGANMAKMLGGAIVGGAAIAGAAILGIGKSAFDIATDIDAATDQIGASLGLGADEAKAYGEAIKSVYANNFGESIADVGTAVETVAKQLKLAANDPSLPKMTENAFRLRDVFEVEVADSVSTAAGLVEEFGITNQQAFDLIARGYQDGLDSSGDYLDTLREYGPVMAANGFSAEQMYSLMESGAKAGVLGTDKIMDAYKELGIILNEGTDAAKVALGSMGLNYDEMAAKVRAGNADWGDFSQAIIDGLNSIEDPVARSQAQVALFGTIAEDMGSDFTAGLTTAKASLAGMEGAATSLDTKYTNLGSVVEGMWRKFQVGIAPAGEAMLGFVNDNLPAIEGVVNTVSGAIVNFIGNIPLALMGIQKGWDEDWAGMRTTTETFADEVPVLLQSMWSTIGEMFRREGETTEESWERFLRGLVGNVANWGITVLESWDLAFKSIEALWNAWGAAFSGDWEGFWSGLGEFYELTMDQMLNWTELFFGPTLRNNLVGAMHWAWDGMKEVWDGIKSWWDSTIGALLGMSGSVSTPDLGIVNPQNQRGGAQQTINDIMGGASSGSFGGNLYAQASGAGAGVVINGLTVSVSGTNDPYNVGREVGRGINDELRKRGG